MNENGEGAPRPVDDKVTTRIAITTTAIATTLSRLRPRPAIFRVAPERYFANAYDEEISFLEGEIRVSTVTG